MGFMSADSQYDILTSRTEEILPKKEFMFKLEKSVKNNIPLNIKLDVIQVDQIYILAIVLF